MSEETPSNFAAEECNTTLVCQLKGGPYDGEEILMAPGDYSHAPLQMVAQPFNHPKHGGCWACYEIEDGLTNWPDDPSGRVVCEYQFDGYRQASCDLDSE